MNNNENKREENKKKIFSTKILVVMVAMIALVIGLGIGTIGRNVIREYDGDIYDDEYGHEYRGSRINNEVNATNDADVNKNTKVTNDAKANANTKAPNNANTNVNKYISETKAKNIAYENAGVKESDVKTGRVELDKDDGKTVYELEFRKGRTEYEYTIDAITGTILEKDVDRD